MEVILKEVGIESLPEYARVPIALEVNSIYVVDEIDGGLGGLPAGNYSPLCLFGLSGRNNAGMVS